MTDSTPPVPENSVLLIGIGMPDNNEFLLEIDMRPFELEPYAVNAIGDQWRAPFTDRWESLDTIPKHSFVHFIASLPNGLMFDMHINAMQINSAILRADEFVFEATHHLMTKLWGGRNLRPTQESVDNMTKLLHDRKERG